MGDTHSHLAGGDDNASMQLPGLWASPGILSSAPWDAILRKGTGTMSSTSDTQISGRVSKLSKNLQDSSAQLGQLVCRRAWHYLKKRKTARGPHIPECVATPLLGTGVLDWLASAAKVEQCTHAYTTWGLGSANDTHHSGSRTDANQV